MQTLINAHLNSIKIPTAFKIEDTNLYTNIDYVNCVIIVGFVFF